MPDDGVFRKPDSFRCLHGSAPYFVRRFCTDSNECSKSGNYHREPRDNAFHLLDCNGFSRGGYQFSVRQGGGFRCESCNAARRGLLLCGACALLRLATQGGQKIGKSYGFTL